jgi:beta-lactam-binding protein with PASTA domain
MRQKLPKFLPVAVIVLVALGATAGLTLAAGSTVASAPAVPTVNTTPPAPLVVPDVRNQAFVFAKGTLADAGFAWRVAGSVQGYAANIVIGQSPAAGTHVIDTGAPLVTLTLKRNSTYNQVGEAADTSPYPATAVEPSDLAGNPIGPAAPAKTAKAAAKATAKKHKKTKAAAPATTPRTATTTTPATTATTPATTTTTPATTATTPATTATTPATTTTTPATTTTTPAPATKTAKSASGATKWPQTRPVAFTVPGARKEPLDEMPLPDRAQALAKWLDAHKTLSPADAKYWLYQNEWIVTGAQMGWWRGAEALQTLIAVDKRTQSLWGIGAKSASLAQQALDEVRAKAKS